MIRFVFILLCLAVAAVAIYHLLRAAKAGRWDWTGLAVAIAFIIAAAWLRGVTDIGGLFG